jgi:hypothetical protein
MRKTLKFFDKLEDSIRGALSKYPLLYAFIGGVGIVLFWRSVWLIADSISFFSDPYFSLIVSVLILLSTGLFVSFFIGDSILLSGIKGEKKMIEKTEVEIKKEGSVLSDLQTGATKEEAVLFDIQKELKGIRSLLEKLNR